MLLRHCVVCGEEEIRTEGLRIGNKDTGELLYLCGGCSEDEDTRLWAFCHLDELIEQQNAIPV